MTRQVRRTEVKPADLYQRTPNVKSGIPQAGDSVEDKVRHLVESGFCLHLPFQRRLEKICSGLYRTHDRDILTGEPTRTSQYIAFERRIAELMQEYDDKQSDLPETG